MKFGKYIAGMFLLLSPVVSFAWTITNNWESHSPWSHAYSGSSIDSSTFYSGDDNTKSLKFTYPAGQYGGGAPDTVYYVLPSTVTEIWFEYYFKYSSNFRHNTVNDKQVYVQQIHGNFFAGYGKWGSQQMFFETQPYGGTSLTLRYNQSYQPNLVNDTWYKIKLHAKMNTIGSGDGIAEMWVNDGLVIRYTDVIFSVSSNNGPWIQVEFTPVYGGGVETIPSEQYLWIDKTTFSNSGAYTVNDSPLQPSSGTPSAPFNLGIQ